MGQSLSQTGLDAGGNVTRAERNNATDLHPANAAGTFSYHHGVAAIRREYLGGVHDRRKEPDWVLDRQDGIEAIRNDALEVKVSFCNVDVACGKEHPKPRSDKGAGAERASGATLFEHAGADDLKPMVRLPVGGFALFYLMVDQQGRAELTRPVIARRTFVAAVERIFLIEDGEDEATVLPIETDGIADEFEPQIVRK
ncbi:hypothetical protein ACLGGT_10510 [Roseovarius sp. MS2]|uniref:hypothetical protein n=1 Tax=Roseovarius sp. MS2 TaxID=3390728 RepID=UPI003EDB7036